jgi:hypothetical protein
MVMESSDRQPGLPAGAFSLFGAQRFLGMVKQSLWVALVALSAAGCGKSGPPTAKLEGTVTLDGAPIATGYIQFRPTTKEQSNPAGGKIENGQYVVKSAPLGKVLVLFNATKETGKTITEGDETRPEAVNIIPQKYQKGIEIEVAGDNPSQNFELKSK